VNFSHIPKFEIFDCDIGVLAICAWCCPLVYTAPASHVPVPTLKGGARVTGVIPLQL
jgi:hypothetical protein